MSDRQCMSGLCRSPVACDGFGYCRERNMLDVGDRVRLRPNVNWLEAWYPLAETGRAGTVIARPDHRTCEIQFDVKRIGARPKVGVFARGDVLLVSKGPYVPPPATPELPLRD